jgi:hypothetical protein
VIANTRALTAGAAVLLVAGLPLHAAAQAPGGAPAPGQSPALPGAAHAGPNERAGLALSTGADSNFARDRNISVSQRPRPDYEARGLRTGAFLVYPKITATYEHNDNIYAAETNEVDDNVLRLTPEVALTSDWPRHALAAYARGTFNRFQDFGTEDTDDYGFGASGRLDVLRNASISGGADHARLTEPRTSPNSPAAALEPVQYDLASARVLASREFNRLKLSGRYGYQDFDYRSPPRTGGGIVDQSFRDRSIMEFMGRADYAVSPDTALFFEVTGNTRDYDRQPPAAPLQRDSDGVQALVGANFELGALTRGEIAVGYISQSFKDPTLDKIDGFGARAQVEWFPTELTTLTFAGSRSVEDSATPGAGAYLSSNISAQIDHELMRNVILTAQAAYGEDEYDVIGRRDERKNFGVSATYMINRVVGVTASYSYANQDTVKGVGSPFTVNKFAATLTAQF